MLYVSSIIIIITGYFNYNDELVMIIIHSIVVALHPHLAPKYLCDNELIRIPDFGNYFWYFSFHTFLYKTSQNDNTLGRSRLENANIG